MAAREGGFAQSYATARHDGNLDATVADELGMRADPMPSTGTPEVPGGRPAAGAGAEGDRGPGAVPERAPARPRGRFRALLEKPEPAGPPAVGQGFGADALAGWFRAEAPPSAPSDAGGARAALPPARPGDRVLVGARADGAEARVRIGAGPLGGTEVRLACRGGDRVVEAQLLTAPAGSRETLSLAMDEMRRRLAEKGIALGGYETAARGAGAGKAGAAGAGAAGPRGRAARR
jgi:hypothetical protein